MKYYEDPILGKGRAADVSGGTGGTEYVGGFGISLGGETISLARYRNIETVTGSSVTMQAGHAYKVVATTSAVTLNTETVPAGQFGLEGHLEIFVAGTGYIVTGTNVVLSQPLEPDSVNNCTVRFHDGLAIISVEDHVAGYIVISASGTSAGSLYYGLATSTNEYIAFDATTNGSACDLGGAVTNGEKHVVGNGYTDTILTGGVSCASKTTFANLAMSAASIVANGSTELVDGHYAIDTVTGTASLMLGKDAILDLTGNTNATPINPGGGITFTEGGATVYPSAGSASAAVISHSGAANKITFGAIKNDNTFELSTMSGGSVTTSHRIEVNSGGSFFARNVKIVDSAGGYNCLFTDGFGGAAVSLEGCTVSAAGYPVLLQGSGTTLNLSNTVISATSATLISSDTLMNIKGTFRTNSYIRPTGGDGQVTNAVITISSGAVVDISERTNSTGTAIKPGGTLQVEAGGSATLVYWNGSAVASKTLSGSGTYIMNNGDTDLA